VERILSVTDYGKGVNTGPQENPERRRPSIIERSTYTGQVTIDDGRDPDLAAANIRFQPLPLACKPLQSVNFSRGQIDLIQLFRVDERHFGQGKSIETIALDRSAQISPQGCHFLRPGFHQPAIRMTGSQVDSHHQPW
jgi:hypothetical protein